MIGSHEAVAALLTGVAVATLVRILVRPPIPLAPRVRPYVVGSRTALGRSADAGPLMGGGGSALARLFGPMLRRAATALGGVIDRMTDEGLGRRLRQAGFGSEMDERERLAAYRLRQLGTVTGWATGSVAASLLLGLATPQAMAFIVAGVVVGTTRLRGRLERAIEQRRERMRIEIYTVNQLLAIRVRAGGGVVHAVSQLVARGRGEVIGELAEALRLHRAGTRAADAFRRIAELTPEPACARTYGLLAISEERGADLASGLLALSEDVRETRREAIRRAATRRRAAMLIPTIAILAPVMLLFVGAPLPSLLLGFR